MIKCLAANEYPHFRMNFALYLKPQPLFLVESKTLIYKEIGEVRFRRSANTRYISVSVRPSQPVLVTVPSFVPQEEAEKFLLGKTKWIRQHQAEMLKKESRQTIFDEFSHFKTRLHTLELRQHDRGTLKISVNGGKILVLYPSFAEASHPKVQAAVHKAIEEAWRIEAKAILPQRVKELAARQGFNYQDVFIKNARTRWGSCSYTNRINLSLHLLMLPDHLIDYVILHELVHTVHKNHGKLFWQTLDTVTGGKVKALEKELNQYRIGIF